MSGYEQFQIIMTELNYKVKHPDKKPLGDDDTLKYLKDLLGI